MREWSRQAARESSSPRAKWGSSCPRASHRAPKARRGSKDKGRMVGTASECRSSEENKNCSHLILEALKGFRSPSKYINFWKNAFFVFLAAVCSHWHEMRSWAHTSFLPGRQTTCVCSFKNMKTIKHQRKSGSRYKKNQWTFIVRRGSCLLRSEEWSKTVNELQYFNRFWYFHSRSGCWGKVSHF